MLFQKAVKIGELLRYRKTREVFLVVHKTAQGVFVVSLMLRGYDEDIPSVKIILPRDIENWDRDTDIDDLEEWEREAIEKKLPMVEQVERDAIEHALEEI